MDLKRLIRISTVNSIPEGRCSRNRACIASMRGPVAAAGPAIPQLRGRWKPESDDAVLNVPLHIVDVSEQEGPALDTFADHREKFCKLSFRMYI